MSNLVPTPRLKITAKASTLEALLQLLDSNLEEDEKIVWKGQPDIEIESKRARSLLMPLLSVLLGGALINAGLSTPVLESASSSGLFFKVAMVVCGIVFLLLSLAAWFWPNEKKKFAIRKLYAVTNKRVIRLEPNGALDHDDNWEWTIESYTSSVHEPQVTLIFKSAEHVDITFATESTTDGFDYRCFTSLTKEQSVEAVDAINKFLNKGK